MRHLVHSGPRSYAAYLGRAPSRWTLASVRALLLWVRHYSLSGIWRLLRGLAIHWKRGRDHIRSPDPLYREKLAYLDDLRARAAAAVGPAVLVYQDELTYYRQPTVATGYAPAGEKGPLAERSTRSNTRTRLCAALAARSGQVTYLQASHVGVRELGRFYRALRAQYPDASRLYVVQDNWPIHFHPRLLAALEPQTYPWPFPRPARGWPAAAAAPVADPLPIQLVPLPTYASWCNPIEKLWRWLRQDVLHLHPWADDLARLRDEVRAFLDQFVRGSDDLLRYVGLLVPH